MSGLLLEVSRAPPAHWRLKPLAKERRNEAKRSLEFDLDHLVGVAILLIGVCGAVLLRERPLGKVSMLLGGVIAAGMLPLHMRDGLRPGFLEKSGALLFIWTLYLLGITGAFSVVLAVQALRGRRVAS